jgi:hypothetical protein
MISNLSPNMNLKLSSNKTNDEIMSNKKKSRKPGIIFAVEYHGSFSPLLNPISISKLFIDIK